MKNPDSAAHNGNGNDDDIVATQAGNALLGVTNESCPITGKALVEIDNPVMYDNCDKINSSSSNGYDLPYCCMRVPFVSTRNFVKICYNLIEHTVTNMFVI